MEVWRGNYNDEDDIRILFLSKAWKLCNILDMNHAIPVSKARLVYSFEHCQALFAKRNNNAMLIDRTWYGFIALNSLARPHEFVLSTKSTDWIIMITAEMTLKQTSPALVLLFCRIMFYVHLYVCMCLQIWRFCGKMEHFIIKSDKDRREIFRCGFRCCHVIID